MMVIKIAPVVEVVSNVPYLQIVCVRACVRVCAAVRACVCM